MGLVSQTRLLSLRNSKLTGQSQSCFISVPMAGFGSSCGSNLMPDPRFASAELERMAAINCGRTCRQLRQTDRRLVAKDPVVFAYMGHLSYVFDFTNLPVRVSVHGLLCHWRRACTYLDRETLEVNDARRLDLLRKHTPVLVRRSHGEAATLS